MSRDNPYRERYAVIISKSILSVIIRHKKLHALKTLKYISILQSALESSY